MRLNRQQFNEQYLPPTEHDEDMVGYLNAMYVEENAPALAERKQIEAYDLAPTLEDLGAEDATKLSDAAVRTRMFRSHGRLIASEPGTEDEDLWAGRMNAFRDELLGRGISKRDLWRGQPDYPRAGKSLLEWDDARYNLRHQN